MYGGLDCEILRWFVMYDWQQFRKIVIDAVDAAGFHRIGRSLRWFVVAGELTWVFALERDRKQMSFNFGLWVAPSAWFSEGFVNADQALPMRPVKFVRPSEFDVIINYVGGDLAFWEKLLDGTCDRYPIIENSGGVVAQETLASREHDLRLLITALYEAITQVKSRTDIDRLIHGSDSDRTVNWDLINRRMIAS